MLSIRILKDIPGYKVGEIVDASKPFTPYDINKTQYSIEQLIQGKFAEEIKQENDIEKIRKQYDASACNWGAGKIQVYSVPKMTLQECNWFTAYRIINAVIEQLNEDIPIMERYYCWVIATDRKCFVARNRERKMYTYQSLPQCASKTIAEKTIELCMPELMIVFGIT